MGIWVDSCGRCGELIPMDEMISVDMTIVVPLEDRVVLGRPRVVLDLHRECYEALLGSIFDITVP